MSGIKDILTTGKISTEIIPIGADTPTVAVTIRIFIMSTIMARAEVGIEAMVEIMVEVMMAAMVEGIMAAMVDVDGIRSRSGCEA
jgi:hypothetical protein